MVLDELERKELNKKKAENKNLKQTKAMYEEVGCSNVLHLDTDGQHIMDCAKEALMNAEIEHVSEAAETRVL